jgi:hypothetical protein
MNMAEITEKNPSKFEGMNLIISKPTAAHPNPDKCIIIMPEGRLQI